MIQPIQTDSKAYITRILAVIIATGIIVGVIFGIYSLFDDSDTTDLESQQRIVTVEVGDVIDSTSIRGLTVFHDRSILSFGISGTVSKIHFNEGQVVKKGATLAELTNYSLATGELLVAKAQYEVHKIQKELTQLENQDFTSLSNDGTKARMAINPDWGTAYNMANALVRKSELSSALIEAEKALDAHLQPSEMAIASAELEYLSLQLSLKAVQQDYDEMLATISFPNINELDHTRARLSVLRHQRDQALATWERMVSITKSQYTQAELEEMFWSAFNRVETAKQALSEVTAQVIELTTPPEAELLALKRTELSQAKHALEDAKARVVLITAPHDGVVRTVHITANSQVEAHEVVIELADHSGIVIKGHLEEAHALEVMPGAKSLVTLDALPDDQLSGQILTISRTPLTVAGGVYYEVTISVEPHETSMLSSVGRAYMMEGLSATIDIIVTESKGVLRIPLHTVTGSLSLPTVTLHDDGSEIADHPISIGNSDDYWVEVTDGLSEGDQVVGINIETTDASENENLMSIANSKR